MRKTLAAALITLCYGGAAAQTNLTVDTLYHDQDDFEARANVVKDFAGNATALIKVDVPLPDASVEQNSDIIKIERHANEIWVYLLANDRRSARELTLQHPNYHTLDIDLEEAGIYPLKGKNTYRLVVGVPSEAVSQAMQLINGLRLNDAGPAFQAIADDPSMSVTDRNMATRILAALPRLKAYNSRASKHALDYKAKAQQGSTRSDLLLSADSAAWYYMKLNSTLPSEKAVRLAMRFNSISEQLTENKVITGRISIRQKDKAATYKYLNVDNLPGVEVKFFDSLSGHVPFRTETITTGPGGTFTLDIKRTSGVWITFSYTRDGVEYTSKPVHLYGDLRVNPVLTHGF